MPQPIESPLKVLFFNVIKNPKRVASVGKMVLLWQRTYFEAQQKVAKLEDAILIETPMDDRIATHEEAIYPYLFACIYITFVASYLIGKISQDNFKLAMDAFNSLILDSEAIFTSHPTRMRDRARMKHPLTLFTQSIDGPTNCYPSQHVSLMVLSYQIIKDDPNPDPLFVTTMRKTCSDICQSTLKTKQHSIIDVIGGMVLANQIFKTRFGKEPVDLIEEIIPELGEDGFAFVRAAIQEANHDLRKLLPLLLKKWA